MSYKGIEHRARGRVSNGVYLILALLYLSCTNRIIERAANDYFAYETGNWWRYSNGAVYDPQIIFAEVESLTSVLGTDCYPVTFSGEVHYMAINDRSISEYKKMIYFFAGENYTVVEGFMTRIEIPLIEGNTYRDSICDSVNVAGNQIKGQYRIEGLVSQYEFDELYGDIYKVVLTSTETMFTVDTVFTASTSYIEEYYAPGIGLVRFKNGTGDYHLSEYQIH